MPEHVHHIVKRLILYICICLLAGIGISGMTAFFHTSFSSTSSILFPLLTSFLMVFHITIACFMGMKYWSSKRRLYLTPVSFGFASLSAADAWHAQQLSGLAYLQSGPGR